MTSNIFVNLQKDTSFPNLCFTNSQSLFNVTNSLEEYWRFCGIVDCSSRILRIDQGTGNARARVSASVYVYVWVCIFFHCESFFRLQDVWDILEGYRSTILCCEYSAWCFCQVSSSLYQKMTCFHLQR